MGTGTKIILGLFSTKWIEELKFTEICRLFFRKGRSWKKFRTQCWRGHGGLRSAKGLFEVFLWKYFHVGTSTRYAPSQISNWFVLCLTGMRTLPWGITGGLRPHRAILAVLNGLISRGTGAWRAPGTNFNTVLTRWRGSRCYKMLL